MTFEIFKKQKQLSHTLKVPVPLRKQVFLFKPMCYFKRRLSNDAEYSAQ